MPITKLVLALGILPLATAVSAADILYEESIARQEEQRIIDSPIAGIENSLWFDYRIDILEAQEELVSDLRRASDLEDQRDVWEEYANELSHERRDYIEEMAERGYRDFTITME
ncbi:MAG: hypothetical protein JY451_10125 [Erythrobacter sp.]|nr:MAG: hypothetical protein JY451_10125 [Erythrobacter sp.]